MSEGIDSLNELGGEGCEIPARANAAQAKVLANLRDAYHSVGVPPSDITSAGALSELCHVRPGYVPDRANVQPYNKELVSWPDENSRSTPLVGALPAGMHWFRPRHLNLRRPADEEASVA